MLEAPTRALTLRDAAHLASLRVLRDAPFNTLGFLIDAMPGMLVFAEDERFLQMALKAPNVTALITTEALATATGSSLGIAVADHPKLAFFELHNHLAAAGFYAGESATEIHPTAGIHPRAWIDARGVRIGAGANIGPNACVHRDVSIAEDVSIRAGAVLGGAGFQTCRHGESLIELTHAGGIEIGVGAIVFENAVVARGVFRQNTVVGAQTRIGAGAFVSHNVEAGSRTHIGHGAVVNGNVRIGADSWVGPGAVISNNLRLGDACRVSLGAVVVRDVEPGAHVSGNFAAPHGEFLRRLSRS